MSIDTYTALQTAIQNWLADTTTTISNRAPEFITLAEQRLTWGMEAPYPFPTRPLRARQMEQRATATADDEYLALPSDYLSMISLKIRTTPETRLEYITPVQMEESGSRGLSSIPAAFTIIGTELRFVPAPSSSYTVEMAYYKAIPALASNSTNWLLTAAPHIYLHGALLEACIFLGDEAGGTRYANMFAGSLNALNSAQHMARSGGALVMRSVTGNP